MKPKLNPRKHGFNKYLRTLKSCSATHPVCITPKSPTHLEYMMGNYDAGAKMSMEWEHIILNLKDSPQDLLEYRSKIILAIPK
jgi:hypothetical protein